MNIFSCKQASRMVSESMDRPLKLRERITLRMHILMCSFCTRFARQMRFLRRAANQFSQAVSEPSSAPEMTLSVEAKQRISRALSEG